MSSLDSFDPVAEASAITAAAAAQPRPNVAADAASASASSGGVEQAAAALVELSGASTITVETYLESVPPTLAVASALAGELSSSSSGLSTAQQSALFTLLDHNEVLALTAA